MTKKIEENVAMDPGDKLSASLSFKKNLGNYESLDLYAGFTGTKRETETADEAWARIWKIVEDQIDSQFEKVENLLADGKK